ncbi:Cloroperoxidase [Macrolepiota fuliginosa MF-IS2]|uniref:Cloroperoxidase n=1 Tax=Macrolepiota fuliginosa MF-IS2 TaxID=1400762 RepID=A0A9P6C693_9AGAR|nr:Cloroperoxidase [Macrolepiota fuliginosa MF-IS2]
MFVLFKVAQNIAVFTWDVGLSVINLVTPNRREGHVTPEGYPGFGGQWPEYVPPSEGDSRCCCPGLNSMANHGIISRDGKNIQFKDLNPLIQSTFNFSPSFSYFTCNYAAQLLGKSYTKDTFDLAEINLHNGIEHDASLCREDTALEPDQGKPHERYIRDLLESATGNDKDGNPLLVAKDISKSLSKRRVESRSNNKDFTLDFSHRTFGSSNSSTFLTIFGGRVKDLETILLEERLPEGWESRVLQRKGLTLTTFNLTTVPRVSLGISEKKYLAEKATADAAKPVAGDNATTPTSSINGADPTSN